MRSAALAVAVSAAVVTFGPRDSAAQVRFGANVAWANDFDLGVGGRIGFGFGEVSNRHPIEGVVSFDYFFPGDEGTSLDPTYWEINANGIYKFAITNSTLVPYVGAGLNYARASADVPGAGTVSDSEVGLNVLGGLRFGSGQALRPFVEVRAELGGGEQVVFAFGLLIGRR